MSTSVALVIMTAVTISGATAHAGGSSTTLIEPSTTGAGVTAETDSDRYHMVVEPDGHRDDHIVVVLGGSNVAAAGYSDFTAHAAGLGFAVVNLTYPNIGTIGAACQATQADDTCFGRARGEIVFGSGVPDPDGETYTSEKVDVDAANSISGRLIALIDYLAAQDPFWDGFLIDDEDSPYTATHRGPVRLDHEKLILTGHSQGGGHAALLAMRAQVERVVMLSSPDDTTQSGTAPWIAGTTATPLDRYWGLRHEAEGPYGQHVEQVWSELGGGGVGAGDDTSEVDVEDGSGHPNGSHRLVLTGDLGDPLTNHLSTAYDGFYLAGVPDAWTYLLTGGGDSGLPAWDESTVYDEGDRVDHEGRVYEAQWWTQNQVPGESPYGAWAEVAEATACSDGSYPSWAASTIYTSGETVADGGSLWTAKWWTRDQVPDASQWGPWEYVGDC